MTSQKRRSQAGRLLWPVVLAGSICLVVAGCGSTPAAVRPLPIQGASDSDDEALRKAVQSDSFPTAAEAGVTAPEG